MIETFLAQLREELGEEEPASSLEQFIHLEGDYTLEFKLKLPDNCVMRTKIGKLSDTNQEEVLIEIMASNLFCTGTAGSIIGLNAENNEIILKRELFSESAYLSFKEKVELFLGTAEFWRNKLYP